MVDHCCYRICFVIPLAQNMPGKRDLLIQSELFIDYKWLGIDGSIRIKREGGKMT